MFPSDGGHWVSAEEAEERILFLVEALSNLKNCNMKLTTPDQLNNYVDSVLQGYK